MVLTESLKKNNILLKPKSKNRWELIDEMIDLAVRNRDIMEEDRDSIIKALTEREKSMSTGIGNGVAIPHCTSSRVEDIVTMISICQKGLDFDAIDNQPVKIVVLLLVPRNKLTQHIRTLANIAKMMSDNLIREKLLGLKTQEGVLKLIKKYGTTAKK